MALSRITTPHTNLYTLDVPGATLTAAWGHQQRRATLSANITTAPANTASFTAGGGYIQLSDPGATLGTNPLGVNAAGQVGRLLLDGTGKYL